MLMIEQRAGEDDSAPWILDRDGRRMPGRDDERRATELAQGLRSHPAVAPVRATAADEEVERVLAALHEPRYLRALREVSSNEPTLMPQWAPPGLPADSPVWAGVVRSAFEGARTAVSAAQRLLDGAHLAYAVCRPPGHHAGPAWMGGYCYLNTAAAAAEVLCEGGMRPVAIVDLDFHFPTGTSAVVAGMPDVSLHSLHASTLENVPWRAVRARSDERFVDFDSPPGVESYLDALAGSLGELRAGTRAIVLSLGYDTVQGDPHGTWDFPPEAFARIGRALASVGLPMCVVQEGGYSLDRLASCSRAFARGVLAGAAG